MIVRTSGCALKRNSQPLQFTGMSVCCKIRTSESTIRASARANLVRGHLSASPSTPRDGAVEL